MTRRKSRIELDTPIVPRAIAAAVLEEASAWLDTPLPRRWIDELTARANTIYARNSRFRERLRARGPAGRDSLWAFTRHWLCTLISEYRPSLHARLPGPYNVGYPLPAQPWAHVAAEKRRSPPAFPRNENIASWATAAHFHVF